MKDIAGSGGRWLDVAPARFPGWIASFSDRHGAIAHERGVTVAADGDTVTFTAPDGAVAACHPPFPPVPGLSGHVSAADPAACAEAVATHAAAPRTVGVLLVRLGGYAAGVFTGSPPVLAASKTGARPVHGRSAAGGWSQHRFARRREKQAAEALQAAASAAVAVFGEWDERSDAGHPDNSNSRGSSGRGDNSNSRGSSGPVDNSKRRPGDGAGRSGRIRGASGARADGGSGLDAVVLGGDKRAIAELREDPRLAPYLALATDRFLTVPDPRLAVLRDTPRLFLAVRIRLWEPAP